MEIDEHFEKVSLLIHAESINGSNNIIDYSSHRHNLSVNGDTNISTSLSAVGDSSLLFDGSGDYIDIQPDDSLNFGTGDFTVEFYIRTSSSTQAASFQRIIAPLLTVNNSSSLGFQVYFVTGTAEGTPLFSISLNPGGSSEALVVNSIVPINDGVYRHFAISREIGLTRMFLDGVLVDSNTDTNNYILFGTEGARIASRSDLGSTTFFDGFLDEIRITKGVSRYNENFSVSNTPFYHENFLIDNNKYPDPYISYVALLINNNSFNEDSIIEDGSPKRQTITNTGFIISSEQSKFYNTSLKTINDSDELVISDDSLILQDEFTIECFCYQISDSTNINVLIDTRESSLAPSNGGIEFSLRSSLSSNNPSLKVGSSSNVYGNNEFSLNTWNHISISRISGVIYVHINGFLEISTSYPDIQTSNKITIGHLSNDNSNENLSSFNGHISDLRVTNGKYRYFEDFIVPNNKFSFDSFILNNYDKIKSSSPTSYYRMSSVNRGNILTSEIESTDFIENKFINEFDYRKEIHNRKENFGSSSFSNEQHLFNSDLSDISLYLKFNEGEELIDSSSNNLSITSTNTTEEYSDYIYGSGSRLFYSSSSVLNVPNSSSLDIDLNENFSIEAVVKLNSNVTKNCLVSARVTGSDYSLFLSDTDIKLYVWMDDASIFTLEGGTFPIDGEFHHVSMTKEGTTYRLFLDGVLTSSGVSTKTPETTSNGAYIGKSESPNEADKFLDGYIDTLIIKKGVNLKVYNSNFELPSPSYYEFSTNELLNLQEFSIEFSFSSYRDLNTDLRTNVPFLTLSQQEFNGVNLFYNKVSGELSLQIGDGVSWFIGSVTYTFDRYKTYSLVVTYNGNSINFFINGILIDSYVIPVTISWSGTERMFLGKKDFSLDNHFYGSIQDLSFYDRELSNYEVRIHYNSIFDYSETPYFDELVKHGPSGYWRLNESDSNTLDYSVNENNGTDLATTKLHESNNKVDLNSYSKGFLISNSYISFGNRRELNLHSAKPFSIGLMFKFNSLSSAVILFSKLGTSLLPGVEITYSSSRNAIKANIVSVWQTDTIAGFSSFVIDLEWHSLVITYDGSKSINGVNYYFDSNLYNDGHLEYDTLTSDVVFGNDNEFSINSRDTQGTYGLDGYMSDVFILNKELSQNDVNILYEKSIREFSYSGFDKVVLGLSPVGYWKLSDIEGPVCLDSSENNYDGVYNEEVGITFNNGSLVKFDKSKSILTGGSSSISVPSETEFNTTTFSVMFIVNPTSNKYQYFISKKNNSSSPFQHISIMQASDFKTGGTSDKIAFGMIGNSGEGGFERSYITNIGVCDGLVHLFIVVFDLSGSRYKLFKDGIDIPISLQYNVGTTDTFSTSSPITIFNDNTAGTARKYSGNAQNFAFFNKSLTDQECKQLSESYSSVYSSEVISKNPLHYWKMNEEDPVNDSLCIDYGSDGDIDDSYKGVFKTNSDNYHSNYQKELSESFGPGVGSYIDLNKNITYTNSQILNFTYVSWCKFSSSNNIDLFKEIGSSDVRNKVRISNEDKIYYSHTIGSEISVSSDSISDITEFNLISVAKNEEKVKFYINDVLDSTSGFPSLYSGNSITNTEIGDKTFNYSDEIISDTAIFDYELTNEDVLDLYESSQTTLFGIFVSLFLQSNSSILIDSSITNSITYLDGISNLLSNSSISMTTRDKYYEFSGTIDENLVYDNWVVVVTRLDNSNLVKRTIVSGNSPSFLVSSIPNNDPCLITVFPFIGTLWKPEESYLENDLIISSEIGSNKVWSCKTSGVSGITEPIFNSAPMTTSDGTVVWEQYSRIIKPITNGPLIPTEIV